MSQQALIALADTAARIGYDEAYDYVTALYGSIASAEASAIEAATSADEALSYKVAAETAATQAAASAAEAAQDFGTLSAELATEVSSRIAGDAYLQGQVDALDTRTGAAETNLVTLSSEVDGNTAAITLEQTVRADADSAEATARLSLEASVNDSLATVDTQLVALSSEDLALGQRIDTVTATVDSNHASVTAELTALATEDLALAGRIDAVQVDVGTNAASIVTESQSRADADGALSLRVDAVVASSGDNAAAITAEETARTSADSALGSRIDTVEVSVGDNTAAITAEQTARADADSVMASDISGLTTRMGTAETNISTEITARTDGDTALGGRIDTLQITVDGNTADISSEESARVSADSALGTRIDTVEVSVGDNTAAITAEQTARTSADSALGSRIDSVEVDVGNNEAAITSETSARVSADSAITSDLTALTGRVTDAEGDISGNISAISGIDGRLTTAEGTISSHTGSITSLQASVNTLPHVYLQDTEPSGGSYNVGDMWLDSGNSNKPSVWDGTIWGPTSDLSGATVYAQDTAPVAGSLRTGDLWLDTTGGDNILHRWNGGAWVDISDPRIAGNASAIETMDTTVTQQGLDITAVANRATSLETRAGNLEADVATIETAYADADEALGTRLDTIEVRMPVGSGTLATSAAVTDEESARVSADGALSGRIGTVESRMPTGVDLLANEARVVTAENTAASATDAVSGRVSTIEARVPSGTDLLANEARVVTVEDAFASADEALSSRVGTMEVRMPLGTGELATSAAVTTEESARVSADGALSGRVGTIEARMPTGTDTLANEARVVTAESAAASATQAVADRTTTLEATVNNTETGVAATASIVESMGVTVSQNETGVATLMAQYVMNLDVNGRIIGWKITNDGTTGSFDVSADSFSITSPTGYKSIEMSDGIMSSTSATHSRYMGVDFGANLDYIDWFGPTPATGYAGATDGAALFYIKNTGVPYFGGTLRTEVEDTVDRVDIGLDDSGLLRDGVHDFSRLTNRVSTVLGDSAFIIRENDSWLRLNDRNLDNIEETTTYKRFSSTEKTKLTGVETGATAGAAWGTNLTGRPTELTDGRIAAGLDASGSILVDVPPARVKYTGGATLDSLKPAEAGAEVTTGKSIDLLADGGTYARTTYNEKTGGSRAYTGLDSASFVAKDVPVALMKYVDGTQIETWKPAQAGADVTAGKSLTVLVDRTLDNITDTGTRVAFLPGERSKLTGVETGATAGAAWGTNLTGRPTELTDGRVATGLEASGKVTTGLNDLDRIATGTRFMHQVQASHDETVDNGNFENDTTLPPTGWTQGGDGIGSSVSFSYFESTSQYAGSRSFVFTATQFSGYASIRKYAVSEGEEWRIEAAVSNVDSILNSARASFFVYDKTGALVAQANAIHSVAENGFFVESGTVVIPSTAAYGRVVLLQNGAGSYSVGFDAIKLSRIRSLDDEVADGTVYARIKSTELTSGEHKLGIAASGKRVGDQRNLTQSIVNAYGSVIATTPLTATSAGAISVNAHTAYMGGSNISYSAVANASTGHAQSSTVVVYCLDPTFAGGVQTWYTASTKSSAMQQGDGVYIAGTVQIPTSGSSGGGGEVPPDPDCVEWDTVLPDGRLVREMWPGLDGAWCVNVETNEREWVVLESIDFAEAECYLLATANGAVIQSVTTPMNLPDGRIVRTPDMLGETVLLWNGEKENVTTVLSVGRRKVVKPNFGNRMFFAGMNNNTCIATHNAERK